MNISNLYDTIKVGIDWHKVEGILSETLAC